MGWNSWNTFTHAINEDLIKETADAMASSGLKDAGYEYVVIDDCWSLRQRDQDGFLVPDPEKFPHGMKAVGVRTPRDIPAALSTSSRTRPPLPPGAWIT